MTYKRLRFQDMPEDLKDFNRLFILAEEGNWGLFIRAFNRGLEAWSYLLDEPPMRELYAAIRMNDNAGLACRIAKELNFTAHEIDTFEKNYRELAANRIETPKVSELEMRKIFGLYK